MKASKTPSYRGRLAPSPTGHLHLGHARTFFRAFARSQEFNGVLIFRNDDLDLARSRPEFAAAAMEDLRWLGLDWQEGPDVGGDFGPYQQSLRHKRYQSAFETLRDHGLVYPCCCTRKELHSAANAPHAADDEIIYPGTCRDKPYDPSQKCAWRFRVPDGETIAFADNFFGPQAFIAAQDFGDFVVWRSDGSAAYQLATVVDDAAMAITEVVRGADLLLSTARQILLYRALNSIAPAFYHCPLITNERGERLAKRDDALSLRTLRERGVSANEITQFLEQGSSPTIPWR